MGILAFAPPISCSFTHLLDKDKASAAPFLVLTSSVVIKGVARNVWRGYLDDRNGGQASAIVAKIARLEKLHQEVKVFQRIQERGASMDGVPVLIGLYKVPQFRGQGVLVQSDCGIPLGPKRNFKREQRSDILISH